MSLATATLPTDIDELRAFAQALQSELYAKTLHIEKLKAQLATLRRARFGQSSEKLDQQIDLLELVIGDLEEAEAEHEARQEAAPRIPLDPRQGAAQPQSQTAARPPAARDHHPCGALCLPGLRL